MPGLLRAVVRTAAVAGTATAVSNRVSRRQAGRWAQQGQPQDPAQPAKPAPAAAPSTDMDSKLDQLSQLAKLRDQGALSDAEFAAEKAKVLQG
ncbi:SHOCT domain-containing protein [Streptomyces sp. RKAG293]|uniref:SHOCT domain-containing protein n=1 Tax=Streptomyces sp. RKAG293 TaxID=2893403 RepID=UPI0020337A91|nr:SHOCT domain-containing protein [Streptomyces sp. RKAG293]MCM2416714.1 SHOCT domain-containing protein [Streptomyces sp. RKAG293]